LCCCKNKNKKVELFSCGTVGYLSNPTLLFLKEKQIV